MKSSGLRAPYSEDGQLGMFSPYDGRRLFRFAVDSHHYQCVPSYQYR